MDRQGSSADSDHDLPIDARVLLRLQRADQVTGAVVERLSELELLARLSLHVPQPYQPLTMRVTAELRCQLPNTSTALSSRSSRAGSRAKLELLFAGIDLILGR